jgi:hypothetical protein
LVFLFYALQEFFLLFIFTERHSSCSLILHSKKCIMGSEYVISRIRYPVREGIFFISQNIEENLEDLTKNCQTHFESVRESVWHYSGCNRKEDIREVTKTHPINLLFFLLFYIIISSSISFSFCPSFAFHYIVNHSHYHHLKVSSHFSSVIFFCVCQFCLMIIRLSPFLNLLFSLQFLY